MTPEREQEIRSSYAFNWAVEECFAEIDRLAEVERKYREAMDVMTRWGNLDAATIAAQLVEAERQRDSLLSVARWADRQLAGSPLDKLDAAWPAWRDRLTPEESARE